MTSLASLLPLALLAAAGATAVTAVNPAPTLSNAPIVADYVEARTASVFAGACHYNGELVTIGTEAVAAFHISAGVFNHTDLSNLNVVATVISPSNLGEGGARRSELRVDAAATPAQVAALTDLLRQKAPGLGEIATVRQGPIQFSHNATTGQFTVDAGRFASLDVQPMPNGECCKQPNLVWYSPLLPLTSRKVGYTTAAVAQPLLSDPWSRSEENSAFYGPLTF